MDKEEEKKLKEILKATSKLTESELFTKEQKEPFEEVQAKIAGALMRSWLPSGWVRKVLMLIIFLIMLFGLFNGQYFYLLLIFLLAIFSPRVIAEVAMFIGRLKGDE